MFVNRTEELQYLNKVFQDIGARLLIVYGRRRIGKTELLRQFSKDKKHLFFSSDLSSEQEQLRQFSEKIHQVIGETFLEREQFTSWESLFTYVFDTLLEKVPVIIIDEFPYLCSSNNALPSILQKVWDKKSQLRRGFLILCGSYMSFMEKEVLGKKSPLFGRRTGQLLLKSFDYKDIHGFFPNYNERDLVSAYAILGGTPAYLLQFSDQHSIERNIKDVILNKNTFLHSEPRFLLMEELREPSVYFSILKAIAFGKTKLNEIVQETGIEDRIKVNKYIAVLRELHLVKRDVPVTEDQPHKSRRGIYTLHDPFFRFWFRYLYPNMSYLEEGDLDYVWEEKIRPDLDTFVGFIFEDICIQKLKQLNRENKLPFKAERIGRWWDGNGEIDIVALDGKSSFLFCECKWSRKKIGVNLFSKVQEKADMFPKAAKKYFGFFSRSGFSEALENVSKERKDVFLFGLRE
jgi:hypothetical protein